MRARTLLLPAILCFTLATVASAQLPIVSIQAAPPAGGGQYYALNEEVQVTATFCSPTGGGYFDAAPSLMLNGQGTGLQYGWGSDPGCDEYGTISGTVVLWLQGTNTLYTGAANYGGWGDATLNLEVGAPPPPPVPTVVHDANPTVVAPATAVRQRFQVTSGLPWESVNFSVSCSGVVSGCSVSPYVATITAANATDVWVTYNVAGTMGQTGYIVLTTSQDYPQDTRDSVRVTIAPNDPVIAREHCLGISAGPSARFECGDLRVVHALPSVRTFNRVRTPTLSFVSAHTIPWPIARTTVTFGSVRPDSVIAIMTLANLPAVRRAWAKAQFPANSTRSIGVGVRADSLATGIYRYTLEVHKKYNNGADTIMHTDTGSVAIVNRGGSPFGVGWWLAGFEQLLFGDTAGIIWVGGDGSLRRYRSIGGNAYVATPVDRPDTLIYRTATIEYVRVISGDSVVFNAAGHHVRTVTRLGHRTDFFVSGSGRLDSLRVHPAAAGLFYRFTYNGSNRLLSVAAPDTIVSSSRMIYVSTNGGRITVIRGPDADSVRFGYASSPNQRRMSVRFNRLGVRNAFSYDGTSRLDRNAFALAPGDSIIQTFTNWDSRGVTGSATAQDTAALYTLFDGPRAASDSDRTMFWPDRFGGVRKVEDAFHNVTLLTRADPRWPALATRVQYANGRVMSAYYDGRGNPAAFTDSNRYYAGDNPTTRHDWDQRFDVLVRTRLPNGQLTQFGIDAANGNRLWVENGLGVSSRVTFGYYTSGYAAGMLGVVTRPGEAHDSIGYNSDGNVVWSESAVGNGWPTFIGNDRIGQVRVVHTNLWLPGSRTDSTAYDVRGRVIRTASYGPPQTRSAAQLVTVRNYYNAESAIDSVIRTQSPNPTGLNPLRTSWTYDAAGRAIVEIAPDGARDSTWYDHAGNVVKRRTRLGDTLSMTYDRMNRLLQRTIPSVHYAARTQGIATISLLNDPSGTTHPYPWFPNDGSDGLMIAGDVETFAYDAMGNLTQADNADARVRRTYFRDGNVATDTLRIYDYARTTDTLHVYGLRYTYDVNGRLSMLRHPHQLAPRTPAVADSVRYAYDPNTGALSQLWDLLGNAFTYYYNARVERVRIDMPGGIRDSLGWDNDGRLVLDRIRNYSSSPYKAPDSLLRHTSLTYNDPVRATFVGNVAGWRDTSAFSYTGLGQMDSLTYVRPVNNIWGIPGRQTVTELYSFDPLGNAYSTTITTSNIFWGSGWSSSTSSHGSTYDPATGRLTFAGNPANNSTDAHLYDAAGNQVFYYQSSVDPNFTMVQENRASFYGADGRLRVAEWRKIDRTGSTGGLWYTSDQWWMAFEEYRYDALGRRVLVRDRRACSHLEGQPAVCNRSRIRRTVWGGDAELWEIQMPGGTGDNLENDTAAVVQPRVQYPVSTDFNVLWGRVGYTYDGAIDRPASITRVNLVDLPWQQGSQAIIWTPRTLVPHWNYRGQADFGTFGDGGVKTCQNLNRCVLVQWRHAAFSVGLATGALTDNNYVPYGWFGTLIHDKEDATGTLYRRHRYVEVTTGRFTQEDPIGLAGGLNLYGFAAGDPINLSDPTGLCPCLAIAAAAWALYEVGSAAYDVYQAIRTVRDPDASNAMKGAMIAMAAYSVLGPGGGGSVVIGKVDELRHLRAGERSLMTDVDLGSPRLNWRANAGRLREAMAEGRPIRDAHVDPRTGALLPDRSPRGTASFLTAERNQLRARGWTYNPQTQSWHPPTSR